MKTDMELLKEAAEMLDRVAHTHNYTPAVMDARQLLGRIREHIRSSEKK